jgi:flagellin
MPKKGQDAARIKPAVASKGTQKKEARPGRGPQIHASNKENPMSLGVLNNLSAITAANNLNKTSNSLSTVLNQLSSGSKINSGADDAAGLSLVDGLEANSTALSQSETNATEGVGLLTVADGALSQVTSLLNRAVTLATEASNGTLDTAQDTAANEEYQSILSEISNIGSTTTYNDKAVFGSTTDIYTGDSSTTGASIDTLSISSLNATTTGGTVGDASGTMAYSAGTSATAAGVTETYSLTATSDTGTTVVTAVPTAISYTTDAGTTASYNLTGLTANTSDITDVVASINKGTGTTGVTASYSATTGKLVLTGVGDSATSLTGSITTANTTTSPTGSSTTIAATTASTATISYTASAGIDLSATKLDNATDAKTALTALNTAISDVAAQDGYIGAQINTLNSVSTVLSTQSENVTSAQNAVQATDYASATSEMSKYEILSQTGIAALAQANSVQQEVTKLLQ